MELKCTTFLDTRISLFLDSRMSEVDGISTVVQVVLLLPFLPGPIAVFFVKLCDTSQMLNRWFEASGKDLDDLFFVYFLWMLLARDISEFRFDQRAKVFSN